MTDISHLDALRTGLAHERERLAAAKSEQETAIRTVWVRQYEREIADELDRLEGPIDPEFDEMSDDELLAALAE